MSTLLALSDVLVIRALERASSRGLTGGHRSVLASHGIPRHRGYEKVQIPLVRHRRALEDAWTIVPELVYRWQLTIDSGDWSKLLDRYCRDLLTSRCPHTLEQLEAALRPLGVSRAS